MSVIHIGAGGWSYFQVPENDRLSAYAKAFDFVEVNSTFYSIPSMDMVRRWRKRVPSDFEFSVKCHRDLTHKYCLSPTRESYEILMRSLRICRELKAQILVIQTPPSFNLDEKIPEIKHLFSSIDLMDVKLAWEIGGRITQQTIELMSDLGIIHCTDISRELPNPGHDILYTRLFGHGKHNLYQFDDAELMQIDARIQKINPKTAYITFHGARMYKDARG